MGFQTHRQIDYVPNMMFAFLDSPVSYHASQPAKPEAREGRRTLRMHMSVPWNLCAEKYGVSEQEYQALHPRQMQATDPQVTSWVKQDLAELRAPVSITTEESLDWVCGREILIPIAR